MSEGREAIKAQQEMLAVLEEPAARLLDRHLNTAKEWFPHEFTPRSDDNDFTEEEVRAGRAGKFTPAPLPDTVRSALFLNLLTEDNLPYYTMEVAGFSHDDHPLMEWTRRWTAEEGRHAIVIRAYAEARRLLDPWALERARMVQVSGGAVPHPGNIIDGLVYTSLQEQATQIAHRNTGRHLDELGRKVMGMVAGDETRHYRFYHDLATVAFEVSPSVMVLAAARQIKGFAMPGTGIPDFKQHERRIAEADIYDLHHFVDGIALPNLESWNFDNLAGLTPEAEAAREDLRAHLTRLARIARRRVERREEHAAQQVGQATA